MTLVLGPDRARRAARALREAFQAEDFTAVRHVAAGGDRAHQGWEYATAVPRLGDVQVRVGQLVLVDELHRFPDAALMLQYWERLGVAVIGTADHHGCRGEIAEVVSAILARCEDVAIIDAAGVCATCGDPARYAAVTAPIGGTSPGSPAATRTVCEAHFHAECVFTNPELLLAEPAFWREHAAAIQGYLRVTAEEFCHAAAAAKISLGAGLPLEAMWCDRCGQHRLDERERAERRHAHQTCSVCQLTWQTDG